MILSSVWCWEDLSTHCSLHSPHISVQVIHWHYRNPIRSTIQLSVDSLLRADFFKENKRYPHASPLNEHDLQCNRVSIIQWGRWRSLDVFLTNTVLLKNVSDVLKQCQSRIFFYYSRSGCDQLLSDANSFCTLYADNKKKIKKKKINK